MIIEPSFKTDLTIKSYLNKLKIESTMQNDLGISVYFTTDLIIESFLEVKK
jgi:hypothetical protein